ncbi:DNA translocase FtsK 4TM domain-containing protein [Maricaulis sp.]|uniref:FtsK/SpoIIIE family DNA translocase n=1 Tax=Maricaulis sp. TaxID=1486257 RepID=UPI001B183A97|nr:DNA translocase FtsK 4TM domain-containing protein [Maricaulis sp.]MBO6763445.1 DNA translocase FtsK 4TM domain-containing protein [Maricaulis sp.]
MSRKAAANADTGDTNRAAKPLWRLRLHDLVAGGLMLAAGLFLLLSLLSHNVLDPSWNVAAEGEVRNWMGRWGASLSDMLLQSVGWAAGGPAIALTIWGAILVWRTPQHRPRSVAGFRWFFAALGTAGFAAAVSALPVPNAWPFASGMGGAMGDIFLNTLAALPARFDLPGATGMAAGFALLLSIAGIFLTFGLRSRDIAAAVDAAGLAWATVRVWLDAVRGRVAGFSGDDGPDDEVHRPVREEPVLRRAMRAADDAPAAVRAQTSESEASSAVKVAPGRKAKQSDRDVREAQGALPFVKTDGFKLPRLDLLAKPSVRNDAVDEMALRQNAELLQGVLSDFGVKGEIVQVRPGPVVTLYEFEPAPGVKSSRVINLADDIARSMSTTAARVAVVPGRNAIGIELPNPKRETVYLRALFNSKAFEDAKAELPFALGETIGGEPFVADLARMPHLLIAGTTGSGKSVGINAMILSLLYRLPPEDCRMIMIDPKMLELSVYDGIPHLLTPVVTDPKKAVVALKWAVREMESRYLRMSKIGVRNVSGFNERVAEALKTGEELSRTVQTGYDKESGEPVYETETIPAEKMPYIVVVIDEMADLMMVAGKEIEAAVQRLAQMARAAGIHLVTATQRPSVDVITGTIKANFPTRISYSVTSKIDSRTILGEQGAEQLLGMGDLLYMASGGRLRRLHGPFVSDREVEEIAAFLKKQAPPEYIEAVTAGGDDDEDGIPGLDMGDEGSGDQLFDQAVALVARDRKASTSYIQRRLQIGYNRAATLIERMEDEGMIGPSDHAGRREIFLPENDGV